MDITAITLTSEILAIFAIIYAISYWFFNRLMDKTIHDELSGYFDNYDEEIKGLTDFYVDTFAGDVMPEEYIKLRKHRRKTSESMTRFFLEKIFSENDHEIFLIFAGAGMGKTTFMINLYIKYMKKIRYRIFKYNYKIKYIPLFDYDRADQLIEKAKKDGSINEDGSKTILLLDGLDEDEKAAGNYLERIKILTAKIHTFKKVIITCRTQFMPIRFQGTIKTDIPRMTSAGRLIEYEGINKYISPFTEKDVNQYLRKKFGYRVPFLGKYYYFNDKRKNAERIISQIKDLVARPLVLKNIDFLLEKGNRTWKEYEIYEALIRHWILRERSKKSNWDIPNFENEMHQFTLDVAIMMYKKYLNQGKMNVTFDELKNYASRGSLILRDIDLASKSLLSRVSDKTFKYSHQNIFQFLLAKYDIDILSPDKLIDFSDFKVGQNLRDQMLYNNLINDFKIKQIYYYTEKGKYRKAKNARELKRVQMAKELILVNFSELELIKFRFIEKVEKIYLLRTNRLSLNVTINYTIDARPNTNGIISYLDTDDNKTKEIFLNVGRTKNLARFALSEITEIYSMTVFSEIS